jgi:hypothetical protein
MYINVFYYPFKDELRVLRPHSPAQVYQVSSIGVRRKLLRLLAYQGNGLYFRQFRV